MTLIGLVRQEEEPANIVERLDRASTVEICAEEAKLMTNTTSSINTEI